MINRLLRRARRTDLIRAGHAGPASLTGSISKPGGSNPPSWPFDSPAGVLGAIRSGLLPARYQAIFRSQSSPNCKSLF